MLHCCLPDSFGPAGRVYALSPSPISRGGADENDHGGCSDHAGDDSDSSSEGGIGSDSSSDDGSGSDDSGWEASTVEQGGDRDHLKARRRSRSRTRVPSSSSSSSVVGLPDSDVGTAADCVLSAVDATDKHADDTDDAAVFIAVAGDENVGGMTPEDGGGEGGGADVGRENGDRKTEDGDNDDHDDDDGDEGDSDNFPAEEKEDIESNNCEDHHDDLDGRQNTTATTTCSSGVEALARIETGGEGDGATDHAETKEDDEKTRKKTSRVYKSDAAQASDASKSALMYRKRSSSSLWPRCDDDKPSNPKKLSLGVSDGGGGGRAGGTEFVAQTGQAPSPPRTSIAFLRGGHGRLSSLSSVRGRLSLDNHGGEGNDGEEFDVVRAAGRLAAALRLQRVLYGLARLHLRGLGEEQTRALLDGLSTGLRYAREFQTRHALRTALFAAG